MLEHEPAIVRGPELRELAWCASADKECTPPSVQRRYHLAKRNVGCEQPHIHVRRQVAGEVPVKCIDHHCSRGRQPHTAEFHQLSCFGMTQCFKTVVVQCVWGYI